MNHEEITQLITAGEVDDEKFEKEMGYAVKARTHLWVSIVPFKIGESALDDMDRGEPIHLDRENMLSMPMVGCLVCEKPYSKALRRRRCEGHPGRD